MRRSLSSRPAPGRGRRMRCLRAALCAAGFVVSFAPGGAHAQDNTVPVQECCLQLLFPYGARAVSLGHTLTSRTSADGLFYNPASLSGIRQDQFVIHHADTFEGQTNVFTLLFDAGEADAFALSYVLVDHGEESALDEHGNPTGTLGLRFHQLLASFATTVRGGLRAGLSFKLYTLS